MNGPSAARAVRVLIRGRVQGVGFRAWTAERATALGLAGWVRNRRDGSVEVVFQGAPDAVADMLLACREGPPFARVEAVEEHQAEIGGLPASFEQRPTA